MTPSKDAPAAWYLTLLLLLPAAGRASTTAMEGEASSGAFDRVAAVGAADFGLRDGLAGSNSVEALSGENLGAIAAPAAPILKDGVGLDAGIARGLAASKGASQTFKAARRSGWLASAWAIAGRATTAVQMASRKVALAAHGVLFRPAARRTGLARSVNAVEAEAAAADKALKAGSLVGAKSAQDEMYEDAAPAPDAGPTVMGAFASRPRNALGRPRRLAAAAGAGLAGAALAIAPKAAHAHAEFGVLNAALSPGPREMFVQQLPQLGPFLPMLGIIAAAWTIAALGSLSRKEDGGLRRQHNLWLSAAALAGSAVTGLGAYLLPLPVLLTPASPVWLAVSLLLASALFAAGSFAAASVLGGLVDRRFDLPNGGDGFRHLAENTALLASAWTVVLGTVRAFCIMNPAWIWGYGLLMIGAVIGIITGVVDLSESIEELQHFMRRGVQRKR